MAQSVSLSTAGTAVIVLNPVVKSTTVLFSATGTSTGFVQVDFSLDDPTIPGGPTTTWATLSSAASMASSLIFATPLSYTVLSPIAQVRINSCATNTGNVFTLKALQSITA